MARTETKEWKGGISASPPHTREELRAKTMIDLTCLNPENFKKKFECLSV